MRSPSATTRPQIVRNTGPYSVVIPTVCRDTLATLLDSLARAASAGQPPEAVVVVVDAEPPTGTTAQPRHLGDTERLGVEVLHSGGRGPAAARNLGWRATRSEWVAFLDDDVVVAPTWCRDVVDDIASCSPHVGATQARLRVPIPAGERPTDWQRNVAGLEHAQWATADMAYRRRALEAVGGFDERFPRAYREDADLGLRVAGAGFGLVQGRRLTSHPVREASRWVSLRMQRNNADDVLMRVLHGRDWRAQTGAGGGRFPSHVLTCLALVGALVASAARRRRLAAALAAVWVGVTADFGFERVAPGPKNRHELTTMAVTTVLIPPLAVFWRLWGRVTLGGRLRRGPLR